MKSTSEAKKQLSFRIPLQFFAEGGEAGTGAEGASGSAGAESGDAGAGAGSKAGTQPQGNNDDMDARIEKLVQSKVDRITADLGKKNADLQKQVEKMKREKMSDEEVKELERQEREKAIADKEKALTDKENRFYAIKALKTVGLDDGSDSALELVDFVMGENTEAIDGKIKSFKALFDKMVTAKVDATFKTYGRTPSGGNGANTDNDQKTNIAAQLGKTRAEQAKKANDILNYYTGGKK